MASRTANFSIDARDPRAQAAWWAQVLDDFEPEPDEDDDEEAGLRGPGGRSLLFLRVPEGKTVKNRMHMCLRPVDRSRDEEVDRLLGLGATLVADLREDDRGWAVLADPEGNEFCVLTTRADEAGIARGTAQP
ncbi:VOC family protein [Blastococcus sp. TF02A-30]|uniref:VOC family protein n=1 Tax=Blastococcus sp. TF02A-30 TaxID=2250580 RepID=UPI000DE83A27|nr:VOC family protein [Blastococcus sp. TF02A-30]RBY92720.1 VOC family protein [Blastococcus sp. TF02A-30]